MEVETRTATRKKDREFCMFTGVGRTCSDPEHPRPGRTHCRSFRCSKCLAFVGWCRGHNECTRCDDCCADGCPGDERDADDTT